jgi:predicted alpha/beta-hydrolase family hydrolase
MTEGGSARDPYMRELRTPALIIQGTRDSFGMLDEVASYQLSRSIRIAWIPEGDHSLKPPVRSGRSEDQNIRRAISLVTDFLAHPT